MKKLSTCLSSLILVWVLGLSVVKAQDGNPVDLSDRKTLDSGTVVLGQYHWQFTLGDSSRFIYPTAEEEEEQNLVGFYIKPRSNEDSELLFRWFNSGFVSENGLDKLNIQEVLSVELVDFQNWAESNQVAFSHQAEWIEKPTYNSTEHSLHFAIRFVSPYDPLATYYLFSYYRLSAQGLFQATSGIISSPLSQSSVSKVVTDLNRGLSTMPDNHFSEYIPGVTPEYGQSLVEILTTPSPTPNYGSEEALEAQLPPVPPTVDLEIGQLAANVCLGIAAFLGLVIWLVQSFGKKA